MFLRNVARASVGFRTLCSQGPNRSHASISRVAWGVMFAGGAATCLWGERRTPFSQNTLWGAQAESLPSLAQKGHLSHVKSIYESGEISVELREAAVEAAAFGGHLDVLSYLLQEDDHGIYKTLLNRALREAASGGHLEVVSYLVEGNRFSECLQHEIVATAAYRGHLDVVIFLFKEGWISEDTRLVAAGAAVAGNHLNIVRFLLENQEDSFQMLQIMAKEAADKGYEELGHYLMSKVQSAAIAKSKE